MNTRRGTIPSDGKKPLHADGMCTILLVNLEIEVRPLAISVTIDVLCVPILPTPLRAPLKSPLRAVMVNMGAFLLTRDTALRPSLLVVQVLERTHDTLPSPNEFLRETVQLSFSLTKNILLELMHPRVSAPSLLARPKRLLTRDGRYTSLPASLPLSLLGRSFIVPEK